MVIQKKIIRFNITMVSVLLFSLVLAIIVFWEESGVQYEEVFEAIIRDENYAYSAKGFLKAYEEEIEGQNVLSDYAAGTDCIEKNKKMKQIETHILDAGFHMRVEIGGRQYIDNLTEEERTELLSTRDLSESKQINDLMIEKDDGTVIVVNSVRKEAAEVELFAVHVPETRINEEQATLQQTVEKFFWIISFLIVFVLVFSNFFYIIWIKKNILNPLQKLQKGSKKISDGELEYSVATDRMDEIGDVCRDFDEMRIQLKEAEKKRMTYEKNKAEILAGISHDLRSPLTSIKGYAEGILDGIANTQEKIEKYCRAILTRAYDMERLSDSLSMYMSLTTDKYQFHLHPTDINSMIKEYVEKNKETDFAEQNVFIQLNLCDDKTVVALDENQILRVFQNLLQNSIKYRKKDTSHIIFSTYVLHDTKRVLIKVADDGPGVSKEDLSNIFDCFYRGDASRTKPGKGSGLGLSIVQQIIEGHQGTIHAENENGLVIKIELPLAE